MGLYTRNGIWYIRYQYGGKIARRSVGRSKRQAELSLARVKADIAEGKFLDPLKGNKITYGQLLDRYLKEHSAVHKKPKSHITDTHWVKHLRPRFGSLLIKDVTADKVSTMVKELLDSGRKPATVNRVVTLLKHSFTKAKEWGLIRYSPLAEVKKLKEDNERRRYLTPEQYSDLLESEPHYLDDVVITAVNTGMRKEEVLSLRKDQINWDARSVLLTDTKNGKPRGVPLNSTMVKLLRDILKGHMRRGISSRYVFIDPWTGDRWKNIDAGFRAKVRRAGLEDFHFHDLRHTAASWMVMAHVDLLAVSKVLGHKDLRMTERYSHLSPGHLLEAVEALVSTRASVVESAGALEVTQKVTQ